MQHGTVFLNFTLTVLGSTLLVSLLTPNLKHQKGPIQVTGLDINTTNYSSYSLEFLIKSELV